MTEGQYSAEKDLLKLIENPGEAESQKSKALGLGSGGVLKKLSPFSFLQKREKSASSPHSKKGLQETLFDRKFILKFLFVVTLCITAYFVFTIFREYRHSKNTKNLVKFTYVSEGKEASKPTETAVSVLKEPDAPAGTQEGPHRNIFKPGPAKKEEERKDPVTVALGDYRLVGLSLDQNETYAMVKNVKTNITFFLKKGEVLNGMEIVDILENKLVLNVQGKQVEFR